MLTKWSGIATMPRGSAFADDQQTESRRRSSGV